MLRDDRSGLLKPNFELDHDALGRGPVGPARQLAAKGLIHYQEKQFVRCIHPLDRDRLHVPDHECSGRIFIERGLDEDRGEYLCPNCNRVVRPSKKRRDAIVVLDPIEDHIRQHIALWVGSVDPTAVERPVGIWQVVGPHRQVTVCWVDVCHERAFYDPDHVSVHQVVYLVGNDLDFMPRLPPGPPRFRIADLAIDSPRALADALRAATHVPSAVPAVMTRERLAPKPAQVADVLAPTTKDLTWSDVTIHRLTEDTVSISVRGARAKPHSFRELGFADGRHAKPIAAWQVLLVLCAHGGRIPTDKLGPKFAAFKQHILRLRRHLQTYFGIADNPVTCTEVAVTAHFQALPDGPGQERYHGADVDQLERLADAEAANGPFDEHSE